MEAVPPPAALAAFAPGAEAVPLAGGQGTAWAAGDVVLKPLDRSPAQLAWEARVLRRLRPDGVRLAPPRPAADGALAVAGWYAVERVAGTHEPGRWPEVAAAGERLHAALADTPRPGWLAGRDDPWARGDRVAWGELEPPALPHVARLLAAARPVAARPQLVHGDLTGNVLFAAGGLPPAVIDLAAYWRPPAFATAVVVADALVWEGAGEDLLDALAHVPELGQLLLRALVYRIVADGGARVAEAYAPAVELALRRTRRRRAPAPRGRRRPGP